MADSSLQRTHPASVAVGTVKAVGQGLLAAIGLAFLGIVNGEAGFALGAAGIIMLFVVGGTLSSWVKWYFFHYGIEGDDLVIRSGWLVRRHRSIPISRVQGVDVRADLVMRVMGVTAVVVQTAGGDAEEPEARIGEISLSAAESLRGELLGRRSAMAVSPVTPDSLRPGLPDVGQDPIGRLSDLRGPFAGRRSDDAEATFTVSVPVTRLLISAVTSRAVFIVAGAIVAASTQVIELFGEQAFDAAERAVARIGAIAIVGLALLALLLSLVIAAVIQVVRDFGFTARRVGGRVETEAGLLEKRLTGLPVRRVQAVTLDESPVQRLLGWTTLRAVSAGFAASEDEAASRALVPIARREEVAELLGGLLPEAAAFPATAPLPRRAARFYALWPTAAAIVATALLTAVLAPINGFAASVAAGGGGTLAVVVCAWQLLAWLGSAFGVDERALGVTSGVLGRTRVRIGRNRIQSLSVRQSPFQRRARLATIDAVGVSGSGAAHYRIRHVDASDAFAVLSWYSARAQVDSTHVPQED